MKSKSILKEFSTYIHAHPDSYDQNRQNAVLYGTDEFKLDFKKRSVKLDSLGWVECPSLQDTDNPDWIALFMLGGKFVMDFGKGNPFQKFKNGYVYQDHWFNLIPLGLSVQ